jgi:hypothetical protein
MKRAQKPTHEPLVFVPLSLVFKGGVVSSARSRRFVGVVFDMVEVDVDGFRCVKK